MQTPWKSSRHWFTCAIAVLVGLGLAGCSSETPKPTGKFGAEADASSFAGPAPWTTDFTNKSRNASGDVCYYWDFDDGSSSTEQNPKHTYSKAAFYVVRALAEDSAGRTAQSTLTVRAWRPGDWYVSDPKARQRLIEQSLLGQRRKFREIQQAGRIEARKGPRKTACDYRK